MNISHLMRQFSIRTRMIGAILMVLVLLAFVGSAGIFGLLRVENQNQQFMTGSYADTVTLASLRSAVGSLRRNEKDMIINYASPTEVSRYRKLWERDRDDVLKYAAALKSSQQDEGSDLASELEGLLKVYIDRFTPIMVTLEDNGYDSATSADRLMGRAKEAVMQVEQAVQGLEDHLKAETEAGEASRAETVRQTMLIFALSVGLAVAVVVPLTLGNMNSICRPLTQAQRLASSIAQGDLTNEVQADGKDETAELMRALAHMQTSLRQLVGQVRNSTDSITTASVEIASGNQDLSSRTEQTASNLQETASSMEQLTGTVKQSADSARQANQLAASAAEVAARGGSVVAQVVSTMDEINASSQKIADIIGVIDGIAFQTNILALNAAVEAARAGEQGRGFAVVAGEVRTLAQRSAQAAKEIKGLIGTSVEKVEGGSRLVADAGQTMKEIVGSVQRVTDIIGEITASASEQSDGISQVNTAVTQLDQMTQQNAALVEQSTAAAESLKEQANRLASVVSTFRLNSDPSVYAAAPAAAAPTASAARTTAPAVTKMAAKKAPVAAAPAPRSTVNKPAAAPAPVQVASASSSAPGDDWETF